MSPTKTTLMDLGTTLNSSNGVWQEYAQMTVSYNIDISSTSGLSFLKLQFRWRGSIWKCIFRELSLFVAAFAVITVLYRTNHFLTEEQRNFWDNFAALFDANLAFIPLTFMLGFFVTIIVGRWNQIFINIGWIDTTALVLATYLRGSDEKSRMYRRNAIRYVVLSQVLTFRDISLQVRRRFPTYETIVAAGLMSEAELEKYHSYQQKHGRSFIPIQWALSLLFEARVSGKIGADLHLNEIMKNITDFRRGLAQLVNFDWVPIPLVYPQVVFLAVRSYFFLCLIARQSVLIDGEKPKDDSPWYPVVPFFMTAMQFMFYVGWMKVAESLMNPMGEDDDDFECNFLLDRNLSVGLSIVDDIYNDLPPQQKDIFWSTSGMEPLYSADTALKPINQQVGSAVGQCQVPDEVVMMPHVDSEDVDEAEDAERPPLPRGISVVSVNKGGLGSRTSLASKSRGGMLETIRKQFSRDGNRSRWSSVTRPSRLGSQLSLDQDTASALDDLVEDAKRSHLCTPDFLDDLSPPSPSVRRSPLGDLLTSVPEEDEEQKTMRAADLQRLKKEAEDKMNNEKKD